MADATNKTPGGGGAMLALADMFVCAASVIIILLQLERNVTDAVNTRPMADVVLRCAGPQSMTLVASGPSAPRSLDGAAAASSIDRSLDEDTLAAFFADVDGEFDRLTLRVRLEHAPERDRDCVVLTRRVVEEHNRAFDQAATEPEEGGVKLLILFDPVRIAPELETLPTERRPSAKSE